MADSIKDLLNNRGFEQPDEIIHIKNFVNDIFDETPAVKITPNSIIITVSNSALAGALRMHLHTLSEEMKTTTKLLIKIG